MPNSKKVSPPKAPARKPAKQAAVKKPVPVKKSAAVKKAPAVKKTLAVKKAPAAKKKPVVNHVAARAKAGTAKQTQDTMILLGGKRANNDAKLEPFIREQKQRLLQLRDAMVDSMAGVAQDTLRSRAEGSEASAFGMHQADAGSDAYDRDFALSLLSQEQDALYEIDEALKRIEIGTYGICEMSGKPIMHARLEAIPFARCTVECQSQLEKQSKASRVRQSVTSLFGLTDEEGSEGEEEEKSEDTTKE